MITVSRISLHLIATTGKKNTLLQSHKLGETYRARQLTQALFQPCRRMDNHIQESIQPRGFIIYYGKNQLKLRQATDTVERKNMKNRS